MLQTHLKPRVNSRLRIASALCCAAVSLPTAADLGPAAAAAFARSIDLRKEHGLDVASFLTRRPSDEDGAPGEALFGLRAGSELSAATGNALLEYSVAVADGGEGDAVGEADRSLLRLRIDSQWRSMDYAVRLFAVGDGYGSNTPAREHLEALGLPGAGSGAELSVDWQLLDMQVQPRVRRVARDEGSARHIEDVHSLHLSRSLLDDLDLVADFETRRGRRLGSDADSVLDTRAADRAHVALNGAHWRLFWTGIDSDSRRAEAAQDASTYSSEVGLRVDVPGAFNLALAPRYRLDRRTAGADTSELITGHLGLSASLPMLRDLAMKLEYRDRRELGADATGVAAVLKMKRPLTFADRLPQGVVLDASLSWRESDAVGRPLWQDGFGAQVSLEYQRAALR